MKDNTPPANEPTAREYWNTKFGEYPQTDADKLAVVMMQEYSDLKDAIYFEKYQFEAGEVIKRDAEIAILEREALELKAGQEYLKKELNSTMAELHNLAEKVPPEFWERLQGIVSNALMAPETRGYVLTVCKNNIKP